MMWEKTLDAGGKENTGEMREEHTGRVGSSGKILERVSHEMPSVRYEKNIIITLLNDSTSGDVR